MTERYPEHLSTRDLLARYWTRTLIARFMPVPDCVAPVDHWANFRGKATYLRSRVRQIEQTDDFDKAFLRSWKARMKGRKPEDVLKQLQARATR